MKPEAQRIAIAEACGWEFVPSHDVQREWGPEAVPDYWIHKDAGSRIYDATDFPDYVNSLEAMHEAEKVLLTGEGWFQRLSVWSSKLMVAIEDSDPAHQVRFHGSRVELRYYTAHATAAQRAEAFLRTLNLWKESAVATA